jgi:hypothetical protein
MPSTKLGVVAKRAAKGTVYGEVTAPVPAADEKTD